MIIADLPYISPLLLYTLEERNIPTLRVSKEIIPNYSPACDDPKLFFSEYNADKRMIANTDGAIDLLKEYLPEEEITKWVSLFKNKVSSRELFRTFYPNFYFLEVRDLLELNPKSIVYPCILKPAVGFASIGVYQINNIEQWYVTLDTINCTEKSNLSKSIVDYSSWIIEEWIDGKEYAIDAYYNSDSKPVILNIFHHPFLDDTDLSDKLYYTSTSIIEEVYSPVEDFLQMLGKSCSLRNFPLHLEVRITKEGKLYPIEVNPMRFAGIGAADLALSAYGINVYEMFFLQQEPDWNRILSTGNKDDMYGFICGVLSNKCKMLDHHTVLTDKYLSNFSNVIDHRICHRPGLNLYSVTFFQTRSLGEIDHLQILDFTNFVV